MTNTPAPGIYHDVPFADYCNWNAVNNSSLASALKSDKHYRHAQDNPRSDTDAFRFGRMAHEGRLEPAAVLDRFVVMPDLSQDIEVNGKPAKNPKATKEYKDRCAKWEADNSDKQVMTSEEFDRMKGVLGALWAKPVCRQWFTSEGPAEVSIVWDDERTSLRCKARIDKVVHNNLLADMKTSRDAQAADQAIWNYGYDRQAAFYLDGWRAVTGHFAQFAFAFVESDAPHGVRAAPASAGVIVSGREKYQRALRTVANATSGQALEGYDQPNEFELPPWVTRQPITIWISGEPVEVYR